MKTLKQFIFGVGTTALLINGVWASDMTIPNSFTADTPAVAAEVNNNFSAAKAAVDDNNARINTNRADIDGHTVTINNNSDDITALTTRQAAAASVTNGAIVDVAVTMTNIDSLTVAAPGPGFIIFNSTGLMGLRAHNNGQRDDLGCYLADAIDTSASPSSFLTLPGGLPTTNPGTYAATMSISRTVSVLAARNVTVYLNCRLTNGGGGLDAFVQNYEINAIYVPNSM